MIEYLQKIQWLELIGYCVVCYMTVWMKRKKIQEEGAYIHFRHLKRFTMQFAYGWGCFCGVILLFKTLIVSFDVQKDLLGFLCLLVFTLSIWYFDEAILGGRKQEIDSWTFPYFSRNTTLYTVWTVEQINSGRKTSETPMTLSEFFGRNF